MEKVLIATTNEGKYLEISKLLKAHGINSIVSLQDIGVSLDVEETGKTLEENATLKARTYHKLFPDGFVIADDTGIEIEALHGEPGIHVRRWKDKKTKMTDEEIRSYALERMAGVPREKRGARARTIAALIYPDGKIEMFEGILNGVITEKPTAPIIGKGLPFETIFYSPEYGMILADVRKLSKEDTKYLTHRERAIMKLIPSLKKAIKN